MNTMQANRMGIARTFQNIRLFNDMSVKDNVRIGLHNQVRYGLLARAFPAFRATGRRSAQAEQALELLSIFGMAGYGACDRRAPCPTAHSAVWRSSGRWPTGSLAAAVGRAGGGHEPLRDGGADGATSAKHPRYLPDRRAAH